MKHYDDFYRRFGVRRGAHLMKPPQWPMALLALPKESIYHHVGEASVLDSGPASNDIMFDKNVKPIYMRHVTEVGDTLGHPRTLPGSIESDIRPYHIRNRRFKRMNDMEAVQRDPDTLIIFNYAFIPRMYGYQRSVYTEYNRWHNQQAAVWKTIGGLMDANARQHFIRTTLPKTLPSVQTLKLGEGNVNQRMVKLLDNPESLFLLEVWKWLGPDRQSSLLSNVPEKNFDRVNLIVMEAGSWVVINLGKLNSWRVHTKEELKKDADANTRGIPAQMLQRRFLRMMMSIFEWRTVAAEVVTEEANTAPTGTEEKVDKSTDTIVKIPTMNRETGKIEMKPAADGGEAMTPVSDEPDDQLHDFVHDEDLNKKVDADLDELETITQMSKGNLDQEGNRLPEPLIMEPVSLHEAVVKVAERRAEEGSLSAAELLRYTKAAHSYKEIVSPDGVTKLDKFIEIQPEMVAIHESKAIMDQRTVFDKSMLKSSLHTFDSKYAKEVFHRDVAGMVLNIQRAGVAVTGYETEVVKTVTGTYRDHVIKVLPIEGAAGTLRFKLPELNDDGSYMANGVKYRLRKQRADLPIRKVAPDRVALTSYYGKTFVTRSTKKVNDYARWVSNSIMAKWLDENNTLVKDVHPGQGFDPSFSCPQLYSSLGMSYRGFTVGEWVMTFDHTKALEVYGEAALTTYEVDGSVVVGYNGKQYLVMDKNNSLYSAEKGELTELPSLEEMLQLDGNKAPVDFAELKVLGEAIPVGFVLSYELGFEQLMRLLGVQPRRVQAGARTNMQPNEWPLVFADETLIFNREDRRASMILAGFNEYRQAIRNQSVYDFDRRDVYWNVLDANKIGTRYLREMDLMYQMFVDPITKELLIGMNEPTDFRGLLFRSTEMLLTNDHPAELDSAYMRLRGNERMAGAVYSELVKAIRLHNGRSGKSRFPIDMNPHAVWQNIAKDPSNSLLSEINPIQNLKEIEAVTYSGVGGRNSRSMTKHTRAYHENDMGTISESTVDSGSVAINTYTSADPQLDSLRGTSRRYKVGETGITALLSTSALLSVGADRDDPKRVNFIGIQHSHGVACPGYVQAPVRTGYDGVLAHRNTDLFAVTAKQAGKCVEVSETGVIVEYADGTRHGFEIGRRFGAAAGLTIPHSIVSYLKAGQKFKEGDILSFNEDFFEKDMMNPTNVVWKAGAIVRTALMETTQTLEDSSAISPRVAGLLRTNTTKVRDIVLRFDQKIDKIVKVGSDVASEDILCVIEDPVEGGNFLFDEESLDTLRVLGAQTPTAKAKGKVERIEVFYHGVKEDMSDSLRNLANACDRERVKRSKSYGDEGFTGSTDGSFRVDGEPLALDRLVLRIYITGENAVGVGDKGVFANQMKTVFGEVMTGKYLSADGQEVEAIFGYKSVADRIVLSPEVIGTTTTLLEVIAKKAVEAYYS